MDNHYAVKAENATVRFNRASQSVDNIKEYFVKLVKRELMFQELIALDGINLEIKKGESWGILGRNGSGKSTLLKLICGIITPYKGTVKTIGNIAPMIELSAGFDGNLTAKENIYLNGAILGHNIKEMKEYYDEIVAFAEVENFLDMPIKNYSSGMKARLGFAIATIVKPDILIVDEVLAVGDQAFRRKCEDKMEKMLSDGATLLFVSHSLEQVRKMCINALWLDNGKEVMQGASSEVCSEYQKNMGG